MIIYTSNSGFKALLPSSVEFSIVAISLLKEEIQSSPSTFLWVLYPLFAS